MSDYWLLLVVYFLLHEVPELFPNSKARNFVRTRDSFMGSRTPVIWGIWHLHWVVGRGEICAMKCRTSGRNIWTLPSLVMDQNFAGWLMYSRKQSHTLTSSHYSRPYNITGTVRCRRSGVCTRSKQHVLRSSHCLLTVEAQLPRR